jgi:hypothetical protein
LPSLLEFHNFLYIYKSITKPIYFFKNIVKVLFVISMNQFNSFTMRPINYILYSLCCVCFFSSCCNETTYRPEVEFSSRGDSTAYTYFRNISEIKTFIADKPILFPQKSDPLIAPVSYLQDSSKYLIFTSNVVIPDTLIIYYSRSSYYSECNGYQAELTPTKEPYFSSKKCKVVIERRDNFFSLSGHGGSKSTIPAINVFFTNKK